MDNLAIEALKNGTSGLEYLYEELVIYTHHSDWISVINIDTLIGAIVGGALALVGSIVVNKIQYKQQAELKRAETIYTPLYDELMKNHYDTLVKTPYPYQDEIGFLGSQRTQKAPQYLAWGSIKLDTRYLETPNAVKKQWMSYTVQY